MAISFPSTALVRRELLRDLRKVRSFVCLVILVGLCIWVALGVWPRGDRNIITAGTSSRIIFWAISSFLLAGCALFVPAFASSAIAAERRLQTYDLLTMTLIRPSGILVGKLLNTVGFFFILVVATIPVLAVVFFLVGLDWVELALVFTVILSTSVCCAMMGILCSTLFRRTANVVGGAYVGMLVLMGVPYYLIWLYTTIRGRWAPASTLMSWAAVTCPINTLAAIYDGTIFMWQFCFALVYQAAIGLVCFLVAVRILRRPQEPAKLETRKRATNVAAKKAARRTLLWYLVDRWRHDGPIEDNQNPMLVKELRFRQMRRIEAPTLAFWIVFLAFSSIGLVIRHYNTRDWYTGQAVLFWLPLVLVPTILLTPGHTANAFTKEYERGSIDLLRMTLMRPREMVLGKAYAAMISLVPVLLAAFLACIVMVLVGGRWDVLLTGCGTLLVCTFISLSLGLLASVLTRRTSASVVLAHLFNVVLYAVSPGICAAIVYSYFPQWFTRSDWCDAVTFFSSPIAVFFYNAVTCLEKRTSAASLYWVLNVATFLLFGVALLWLTTKLFQRYRMRDP